MTTITVNRPALVVAPRGAIWAATAAAHVLRWLSAREGQAPAQSPLKEGTAATSATVAVRAATAPTHDSAQLRTREAARVRRIADQWRTADPRFAADLYAAADRHER